MKIPIVNENDEVIGFKDKLDRKPSDIMRISSLWITDHDGNILLAKRAGSKRINPNQWAEAVTGTVEEDEDYDSNIIKEAWEELGLKGLENKIQKSEKIFYDFPINRLFVQWYFLQVDKSEIVFNINEEEVAEIKWVSKKELNEWIKIRPMDFVEESIHDIKFLNLI
jgi:isopentenyldiphosphate isomerase